MKKSTLLSFLGFAMLGSLTDDAYAIEGRGKVANSNEPPPPPKKEPTPFKKQEGIVNLIKDYKLIKSGQSKKGKVKQSRIVSKVEELVAIGKLNEVDLGLAPTIEEINEYMELHNSDEVGIDNQWTFEDAEYHLLLSDKYHNQTN